MKSSSCRGKLLEIIIGLILFQIHKYLWGTDAVFLWRYPHISSGTNFELWGWNQLLAEANCSKSSGWSNFQLASICEELTLYFSGWWYFWLNWISLNVILYFSAVIPIFLIGLTLHWRVEMEFNIIIRTILFVMILDLWDSNIVFLCKLCCISKWHNSWRGGQNRLLKKAKSITFWFQMW